MHTPCARHAHTCGARATHAPRTDDEHNVGGRQVVVDLLHLEDDVVRHAGLGQQHVELAGHAPRHRVDGEAHRDPLCAQIGGNLGDGVLCLGDG